MSDPEAMDVATMEREALRERLARPFRTYGIGASDVAKCMLSLGWRQSQVGDPGYLAEAARPLRSGSGEPRWLLQKALVIDKPKRTREQLVGIEREGQVFAAWRARLRAGEYSHEFERSIDPESPRYATTLPDEWPPLIDRECSRLVTRVDSWARDLIDELVDVQIKLARYEHWQAKSPVWWSRSGMPWWHDLQCQAEMAVTNARHAVLVIGCGWIRDPSDRRGDGPIRVMYTARSEERIAEIRDAVRTGWAQIERLRANAQSYLAQLDAALQAEREAGRQTTAALVQQEGEAGCTKS